MCVKGGIKYFVCISEYKIIWNDEYNKNNDIKLDKNTCFELELMYADKLCLINPFRKM